MTQYSGALAGTFGSFSIPGTPNSPVGGLNNWSITTTAGNYDASVLGDTWREFVSGLKGWSGSLTGFYGLVSDTNGQRVLYNALVNNLPIVGVFQTVQGGGSFEGTFHVITSAVSNPVDGLITITFDFQGTGSLQVLD
jgi:predicted secreted protein